MLLISFDSPHQMSKDKSSLKCFLHGNGVQIDIKIIKENLTMRLLIGL